MEPLQLSSVGWGGWGNRYPFVLGRKKKKGINPEEEGEKEASNRRSKFPCAPTREFKEAAEKSNRGKEHRPLSIVMKGKKPSFLGCSWKKVSVQKRRTD